MFSLIGSCADACFDTKSGSRKAAESGTHAHRLSTHDVRRLSRGCPAEERSGILHFSCMAYRRQNGEAYARHLQALQPKPYTVKNGATVRSSRSLGFIFESIGREQMRSTLPHTHLISRSVRGCTFSGRTVRRNRHKIQLEKTNLVSKMFNQWGGLPAALLET